MLDLLLPQRCVVCEAGGSQLCVACRDGLQRLEPPLCARCGAPVAWPVEQCRECAGRRIAFASARAAAGYDEAARRVVHAWKERGLRRLAADVAALELGEFPLGIASDGVVHLEVLALDVKLHRKPPLSDAGPLRLDAPEGACEGDDLDLAGTGGA